MAKLIKLTCIFILLSGCSAAYFSALEKIGIPKRDLLSKRVVAAKDAQSDAQEQFVSALDAYRAVVKFDAGELGERYNKLNSEYESSVSSAENVEKRISRVESVAEALFEEWEGELDLYQNPKLRRSSETKLRLTRVKYQNLLQTMRAAEDKIEPVLLTLRDQVTFLKHNLNSSAIGALQGEAEIITEDVDELVSALQISISEAEKFIATIE